MPTDNRPTNTENLPCPFCAGRVDLEGWLRGDGTRGPECESCGATAPTLSVWNSANPTTQPHPEPIAWMVGTAFWWTKEEAERDAAESGLPIVGLGPMTESADIDQLQLEIAELQLALTMHDDAAIQDECIRAENSELHAKLAERNAAIIPELTSDLREILGRPNFTCHHIAKALRVMGLTIAPKSEDEQAAVIHWLLGHYLKHGADWRQRAAAELEAASETIKA